MRSLSELRRCVAEALAYLRAQPDIREAEVFAAANGNLTVRLNYTSHIPSNGVEEPKSLESYGLGIRVALDSPEGVKVGFGSEPSDLSLEGARRALAKARRSAVHDPDFVSLPKPGKERRTLRRYHDPAVMRITDRGLVEAGWRVTSKALEAFQASEDLLSLAGSPDKVRDLGLILGGDVVILQERAAIGSYHLPRIETDESTLLMSLVTAMVEEGNAKGTGWQVASRLEQLDGEAGAQAARRAVASVNGRRVPGGKYRVVLGPQAVAEILEWIVVPGLNVGTFYAQASPFNGKMGQRVASDTLLLYDHGAMPGLAATKAVTDEGLPTGRTDLIADGRLVGLLSNYYEYQRILRDPKGKEKLGVEPQSVAQALAPRNGFRTGRGGGRNFDSVPTITPTNLILEGRQKYSSQELFRLVGDGLYIGRLWYTYPVNGLAAGDFSGTVVGDSFIIRNGRLAEPLKPNTLRINDNIHQVLNSILGIGEQVVGTVRWASDQVT